MTITWLSEITLLFRPEESNLLPGKKYAPGNAFQSMDAKSSISVKALVWAAISVMVGLLIGQL